MFDDSLKLAVKLAELNKAPIPKCKKCGHEICIHCGNWCDILLEDNSLCCGGACEI